MNGRKLSAAGLRIMTAGGWVRIWNGNWRKQLPAQMRGISDNIYIRDGVLLFIEDKGDGDSMRPEQEVFKSMIDEHAPRDVLYLVAECPEDYEVFVNYRSSFEKY